MFEMNTNLGIIFCLVRQAGSTRSFNRKLKKEKDTHQFQKNFRNEMKAKTKKQ